MASPFPECDDADYEYSADVCDDILEPGEVRSGEISKRRHRKRKRADVDDEETEETRLLANSQERDRMRRINGALDQLRRCLPRQFHVYQRRMSKIRTLRLAVSYISALSDLLQQDTARRQAAYPHSMQQMLPASPAALLPPGLSSAPFPSPANPYYPYLGAVCGTPVGHPADPRNSLYSTPLQTPPRLPLNPVKLDFFATPTHAWTHASPRTIMARAAETPDKGDNYNYPYMKFTPSLISGKKMSPPDSIISPFLGMRNSNELDLSAMSASSDTYRDDQEESSACCRHPGIAETAWNGESSRLARLAMQTSVPVSASRAVPDER